MREAGVRIQNPKSKISPFLRFVLSPNSELSTPNYLPLPASPLLRFSVSPILPLSVSFFAPNSELPTPNYISHISIDKPPINCENINIFLLTTWGSTFKIEGSNRKTL
jgi:hypothetical protein